VLSLNDKSQTLHQSKPQDKSEIEKKQQYLKKAKKQLGEAEHKYNMANLLGSGGFAVEAMPALGEAVEGALQSLALLDGQEVIPLSITHIESQFIAPGKVNRNAATLVAQLRENSVGLEKQEALALLKDGELLMQDVAETLNRLTFR